MKKKFLILAGAIISIFILISCCMENEVIGAEKNNNYEKNKYIKYNMDLNENYDNYDDWKIFYVDDEFVYIIASDYVPVNYLKNIPTNAKIKYINYCLYWANNDLPGNDNIANYEYLRGAYKLTNLPYYPIDANMGNQKVYLSLINPEYWKSFLTDGLLQKGGVAYGAPTADLWIASYNEMYNTNISVEKVDGGYGYKVKNSSSEKVYIDLQDAFSNEDIDLYFPHQSADRSTTLGNKEGCYGYWLASPSALNTYQMMRVDCDGYVYCSSYTDNEFGIRPVIRVTKSLVKTDDEGNYYIDEESENKVNMIVKNQDGTIIGNWTNRDVECTLRILNENNEVVNVDKIMYKISYAEDSGYIEYTGPFTVTQNCTIAVKYLNGLYESNDTYCYVTNIDKNDPSSFIVNSSHSEWNDDLKISATISFNFKDEEKTKLSGLSEFKLYYKIRDDHTGKVSNDWKEAVIKNEEIYNKISRPNTTDGDNEVINKELKFDIDESVTITGAILIYAEAYDVAGNIINCFYDSSETNKYNETNPYPIEIRANIYEIILDKGYEFSNISTDGSIYEYENKRIYSVDLEPGEYKLETWGANGGDDGGKGGIGGYAAGTIKINKNTTIYVCVGGKGEDSKSYAEGGYNGGGYAGTYGTAGGGGGATSISTISGVLSEVIQKDSTNVLLVAGGGGRRWN